MSADQVLDDIQLQTILGHLQVAASMVLLWKVSSNQAAMKRAYELAQQEYAAALMNIAAASLIGPQETVVLAEIAEIKEGLDSMALNATAPSNSLAHSDRRPWGETQDRSQLS
jgi:hypothetical protein